MVTEDFVRNLFIDEVVQHVGASLGWSVLSLAWRYTVVTQVLGGETLVAFGTSVPDILGRVRCVIAISFARSHNAFARCSSVFLAKNGYADAALSNAGDCS